MSEKSRTKNGAVVKKNKPANSKEVSSLAAKIRAKALENQKKLQAQDEISSSDSEEEEVEPKKETPRTEEVEQDDSTEKTLESFSGLNIVPELLQACKNLNFTKPTPIQAKAIPPALEGKDIIGQIGRAHV